MAEENKGASTTVDLSPEDSIEDGEATEPADVQNTPRPRRRRWGDPDFDVKASTGAIRSQLDRNRVLHHRLYIWTEYIDKLENQVLVGELTASQMGLYVDITAWLSNFKSVFTTTQGLSRAQLVEGLRRDWEAMLKKLETVRSEDFARVMLAVGNFSGGLPRMEYIAMRVLLRDTLRHRRLEILCRYGDYLAERLEILRRQVNSQSSEDKDETEQPLPNFWTETSAILDDEEGKKSQPCRERIEKAADDLDWSKDTTLFMIHQYAQRNSLMHAELFDLVKDRDWPEIAARCEEDIDKLQDLFLAFDGTSESSVRHWKRIIQGYRDRWVHNPEGKSTWEARPIVKEAVDKGLDGAALEKLARRHDRDSTEEIQEAVAEKVKAMQSADKQHQKEEAREDLKRENNALRALMASRGVSEDMLTLQQKNTELENEIKKLRKDLEKKDSRKKPCDKCDKSDLLDQDDAFGNLFDQPGEA